MMEEDMQASSHTSPVAPSPLKRLRPQDMPVEEDSHAPMKKPRESLEADTDDPDLTTTTDNDQVSSYSATSAKDKGKQRMVEDDERPERDPGLVKRSDDNAKLVVALEEELSCGCCAGLVYRPVVLQPCQHFFCGSCLTLWIQNSGSNSCPQCRTPATVATLSRTIQSIVDLLLRYRPDLQRSESERKQADETWPPSPEIKIPQPKQPNPDLLLPQSRAHDPSSDNLARPCPHCLPHNQFGWRCPRPIADPDTHPAEAWNLDNGPPPGHGFCGACSELHALVSPGSSACSLCKTSFCGLSIPHLCVAPSARSSRLPQSAATLSGLLESHSESIWENFEFNDTEIDVLLDWLREGRQGSIRAVYQEIIENVRNSEEGFRPMISAGLFVSDNNNINPIPEGQAESSSRGQSASRPEFPIAVPAPESEPVRVSAALNPATGPEVHLDVQAIGNPGPAVEPSSIAPELVQSDDAPQPSVEPSSNVPDMSSSVGTLVNVGVPGAPVSEPQTVTMRSLSVNEFRALFGLDFPSSAHAIPSIPRADVIMADGPDLFPPMHVAPEAQQPGTSTSGLQDPIAPTSNSTTTTTAAAQGSSSASPNEPAINRICRDCAFEIFLHELYPWWARERQRVLAMPPAPPPTASAEGSSPGAGAEGSQSQSQSQSQLQAQYGGGLDDDGDDSDDGGYHEDLVIPMRPPPARLPDWYGTRSDCPDGRSCPRQRDISHAKEFNHIIFPGVQNVIRNHTTIEPTHVASEEIANDSVVAPAGPSSSGMDNQEQEAQANPQAQPSADEPQTTMAQSEQMDIDVNQHEQQQPSAGDVLMEEISAPSGPIIMPSSSSTDQAEVHNGPTVSLSKPSEMLADMVEPSQESTNHSIEAPTSTSQHGLRLDMIV